MHVISFCLNGKMAHFRKYYSNSTALSYLLPPVTTIKGILAGLLGIERDQYYALFAQEKCKVALAVAAPIKKTTQTLNLLKVETLNDLNGAGKNRTQNNTEFIMPKDIQNDCVSYQVVFSHEDERLMEKLTVCLCRKENHYQSQGISLALGTAPCLGWIADGQQGEIVLQRAGEEIVAIDSAVPLEKIKQISTTNAKQLSLIKEETILDFDANRYIMAHSKKNILLNADQNPIFLSLKNTTTYFVWEKKKFVFLE